MTEDASLTSAHRVALGATVRTLRDRRGLTVRDLARMIGVSAATISNTENGRCGTSSERLIQFADALGVRVDRLLTATAEPVTDDRWSTSAAHAPGRRPGGSWRTFEPVTMDPALRGALASFLEFGYHGSTMRGIAERAGLSVAGLYHYYGSKQQMLVTILDLTMTELAARTTAAFGDGADPAERFANLVECLALFHTHRRELGFIGASEMRSLVPVARHRIAGMRTEEQHKVDRQVEAGCRDGSFATRKPNEAARAVVTMCTALSQWYRAGGATSPEEVAAQYVDFALDLVRCEPSARPQRGA